MCSWDVVIYNKKYIFGLKSPWSFLNVESFKGVFFMLMSDFWKVPGSPKDQRWLPVEPTLVIRGLELSVPRPDFWEGRAAGGDLITGITSG